MAMEMAMEEFMRKRGIPQPIIEEMTLEKIDCETISIMSDDDLKRFIPLYGDRLAIVTFAKSQVRAGSNPDNTQQEIRASTMGRKRKCPLGNKNASRTLRRVELGWVNYNQETSSFKQVRTKNGGGTRQLLMEKNLNVCDICALAKSTFFPNNISKFGTIDEFNCEIRDFKGDDIPLIKTVDDIYTETKLRILRLYLYTKKNPTNNTDTTKPEESESSSDEFVPFNLPVITITSSSQQSNTAARLPDASPHESTQSTTASERFVSLPITGTGLPVVPDEQPSCSRAEDEFDSGIPEERRNTVSERNEVTALVSTDAGNNFRSASPDLPDLTTSTGAGLCYTTLPANTPGFSEASTSAADRTQFIASSGTPEVTFHPRLSLRHRSREMSRSLPRFQREVVEVVDTEDEELERAIQASLLDHVPVQMQVTESKTLNEVLTQLYDRWVSDSRQTIIVSRKTVLESAFRALERITFKLNGKMFVKFSGEIGEDYGGPRREFFRLALDELQGSHIFCGTESKYFNHDVDLLEKGRFRLAGKLIALSFIHDGPSPHFMDPTVFDLMLKGTADMKNFNAVTLPADVQAILKQLTDVDTIDAGNNFIHTNGDWLIENGFNNIWGFRPEDKDTVYNQIIKQIVYYRCSAEINEFTLGMNDVGEFWNTVKNYPDMFKSEFCGQTVQLTRESFEALCKLDLSEEGSNSRQKENDTVYGWELFLQDIDEQYVEVTFAELLSFITGTDRIPPRGFQKKIDIHFFTSEHGTQRLPSVSTCALELNLPRGITDPEEFKANMIRSLKESQGFHKI